MAGVKRINRKKNLFPRFFNFKEGAKLTYDPLRFLFRCYFDSVHVVHVIHTFL